MRSTSIILLIGASLAICSPATAQSQTPPPSRLEKAITIPVPSSDGSMAPSLSMRPGTNDLCLTWLEPDLSNPPPQDRRKRLWSFKSAMYLDAGQWSPPQTLLRSTQLFVNWADTPGVTLNPDGTMWSHHLERSGGQGTYAYHVVMQQQLASAEDQWIRIGPVHEDRTNTEHGFVSYAADDIGTHVFWLDGRAMTGDHGSEDADESAGAMALRTRRLGSGIGAMSEEIVLDERVCECCSTDAAMTANGPIVVYRDRDQNEVRDISAVRLVNGSWTSPAAVHADGWQIAGCPVNGPAVAAHENNVVVAWFTSADNRARINVAISYDAGATFDKTATIDQPDDTGHGAPDGRVDVAIDASNGVAFVLWLDRAETSDVIDLDDEKGGEADYTSDQNGVLRLAMIDLGNAAVRDVRSIARTSSARSSGFPKLAIVNDGKLLIVWTAVHDPAGLRACEVSYSVR